jgi:hypothetical protein
MFCTHYAVFSLTQAGFIINSKSVLEPSAQLVWLGKTLFTRQHTTFIHNAPTRIASLLCSLSHTFVAPLTPVRLLRILGLVQWLARPASEITIFLAPYYRLLNRRTLPRFLPLLLWSSLLQCAILVSLPAITRAPPLPLTFPPFFVDAAPDPPLFRVASNHCGRSLTSALAPRWVRTQNQGELYGIFHTLRQAALLHHTRVCIVTDSSASYFAVVSGRASALHPIFLRLLRRIWRIAHEFGMSVAVALTSSLNNPADPPSRLHQLPFPLALLRASHLYALTQPFPTSTVIARFWQRGAADP